MTDTAPLTEPPLQQRKEKSLNDLENMLETLDTKLGSVVSQLESVKQTRDELLETTKDLKAKLETRSELDLDEKEVEKLKAVSSEVKRREEMVRALERRELILSHSMLAVISNWADKVEMTFGTATRCRSNPNITSDNSIHESTT